MGYGGRTAAGGEPPLSDDYDYRSPSPPRRGYGMEMSDRRFKSTSLEERSPSPSPGNSPRRPLRYRQPHHVEYYGTHELSKRSRSPSPPMSDDSQLVGPPRSLRQRHLPSLSMPSMPRVERSPTVPQRGYPDDVSFPRLATSPTLPTVGFNEFYPGSGGRYAPPPAPMIYPHRAPPVYNNYGDPSVMYHVDDAALQRSRVIRAQPGNVPLSDSEPEPDWPMI